MCMFKNSLPDVLLKSAVVTADVIDESTGGLLQTRHVSIKMAVVEKWGLPSFSDVLG